MNSLYEWKTEQPTKAQCEAAQRELVAALAAAIMGDGSWIKRK